MLSQVLRLKGGFAVEPPVLRLKVHYLWLYNAPLVAFYDTLRIRRTSSRLKPPASSRGYRLSNFENGDNAQLDDIFSKKRADDPNKQEIEIHEVDTAGLASTVHKLIERVTNLEQA